MSAPICLPGTSRVKAGFDPTQILLGDAIGDVLVGLGMGELAAVFASVGVLQFALDAVCGQDPPALPTIDAAKLKAYYDSQSQDAYPLVLRDAQDLVGHYLWYQWCECVGSATPPPPAPTPLPPGVNLGNSPIAQNPATCYTGGTVFLSGTADANGDFNWTWQVVGATLAIGANTQWFNVRSSNSGGSFVPVNNIVNYLDQVNAAGTVLQTDSWTYATPPQTVPSAMHTVVRANAATGVRYRTHNPGGLQHVEASLQLDQICSGLPPQLRQDCCPPDPELENLILQVLRFEQLILQSLGGSTAYIRGTVHSGLTGSGSLAVTGLRGVAVSVTAGTPTTPLLPGNPPYQWDLGWMSIMTGDGMIEERRLTRQTQVWLPTSMSLAITFGYFLFPGVVATITELDPA